MSPPPSPIGRDAAQVVRIPHPADGVGAALRGAFGCGTLPEEMACLLRRLDQPR